MTFQITDAGRKAIEGDNPAGQDVRYGSDFLALQAEMDKLTSMSGVAGGVNWVFAADLGWRIIAEQSKDLLVAAYLGAALEETAGLSGFLNGLVIFSDILDIYWDNCLPPLKRLRARVNALAWWQEKAVAWLGKYQGPELSGEDYAALNEAASRLDQLAGEKMPDAAPLADILNLVRRLPHAAPASEPEPEPKPAPEPAPAASSAPPPLAPPVNSTPPPDAPTGDAIAARKRLAQAAADFAQLAAGTEIPTDPWIWKANRWRLWLGLGKLPPAEAGRTLLPPPPEELRRELGTLFSAGRHREAALAAENQVGAYIFWLDLHYYCGRSLAALGSAYQLAAEAVRGETRNLILSWPGLPALAFNDGSPLASPEALAWLAESGGGEGTGATPDELSQLDALVAAGDVAPALALLSEFTRQNPAAPLRLKLLIRQVDLLLRTEHRRSAGPLADRLLAEVDRLDLENWDPPLAKPALLAALKACQALGGTERLKQAQILIDRLAFLDPEIILTLRPTDE
jgi:type VI secretion system protein VasJ